MNPPGSDAIVHRGGGGAPSNIQQIGNLVRFWVHYDNTLTELNKQTKQVRDMRKNYEAQILQGLKGVNMSHPVIQIAGGRLTVGEEKHTQPLSFKTLETLLHQYHRQKPGKPDDTKEILNFIRQNRTSEISEILKRTHTPSPEG